MVVAGFAPGIYGLLSSRLTTELPKPTSPIHINSNFDLKKTHIKCIIKVVNVSKSQYYEFRHNIMKLENQNSKYSWRIRDLEIPQPEHNSRTPS